MSDCNHCIHKRRLNRWKEMGIKVKLMPDPIKNGDSPAAFPKGVKVVNARTGKEMGIWYAELPDHCTC
jgi:hypothetical protein